MASKKRKRLQATVTAIQRRWGWQALQRGQQAFDPKADVPHFSTTFPALDEALAGIGGIPRSRITEILGEPTSGMVTLALKIVTQAQAQGDTAIYIDLGATFDPDYAARCGVKLSQLLLVRPTSGREALDITRDLVAGRGTGLVIFDSVANLFTPSPEAQGLATSLRTLPQVLTHTHCALIFLTPLQFGNAPSLDNYPSGLALPHFATVRLLLHKERWLQKQGDIRGYQARVLVLKNKLGPAGRSAQIAITFNGVVHGDST
ncbi:MAG: hypothetical protein KDI79_06645 [Anaerolineae bacterium]|nr:hypothetical protein [Anaerolineae bacterium]